MLTNKEQKLLSDIRGGNTHAYGVFVDQYKDLVYTLTLRMLGNREEAEEVSQDTFIKIFNSLDSFKGDSKISSWIYRIAYNTSLDRIKKNKKRRVEVDFDFVKAKAYADVDNAMEKMVQQEKSELINACMGKLSAEDAAIVTLFYFEEKNLVEMEKILNLSVNTLKVRLFRARKKLADIMQNSMLGEILESNG
ncbi:RNA polymerase sigma factor [Allomuricauda sp. NBRC 101325]|uniref:RNA polymerase sigma factor n=1 Tax=Allomuricauda sp. NBRC 101325 TaxID=1113758 RepID=UPI0024A1D765|nr:sigma-70 family RNA polymerase sigma factor [Muricauda sp. NBRC 101325]GLU45633.1 DNA-directed RNA polymerase sigma-70 factor [Muricauda sp. NBRC 101325]